MDIARIHTEGEYGFRNLNSKTDTSFGRLNVEVEDHAVCYLFQPEARLAGIDVCYTKQKEVLRYVLPGSGPGYLLMTRSDSLGVEYCISAFRKSGETILQQGWRRWNGGTAQELQTLLMPPSSAPHPPKKLGVKVMKGDSSMKEFTMVEQMPDPGYNYLRYLSTTIKYPEKASLNGIGGVVYVNFLVQPSGKIEDVRITKGVEASLDEEALRVLRSMPAWIPGMQVGAPVPVRCQMPIRYRTSTR